MMTWRDIAVCVGKLALIVALDELAATLRDLCPILLAPVVAASLHVERSFIRRFGGLEVPF